MHGYWVAQGGRGPNLWKLLLAPFDVVITTMVATTSYHSGQFLFKKNRKV